MSQTKVTILGASGMLGSIVTDFLSRDDKLSITATVRSPELIKKAGDDIRYDARYWDIWNVFER